MRVRAVNHIECRHRAQHSSAADPPVQSESALQARHLPTESEYVLDPTLYNMSVRVHTAAVHVQDNRSPAPCMPPACCADPLAAPPRHGESPLLIPADNRVSRYTRHDQPHIRHSPPLLPLHHRGTTPAVDHLPHVGRERYRGGLHLNATSASGHSRPVMEGPPSQAGNAAMTGTAPP
jgi:hypothetical protein